MSVVIGDEDTFNLSYMIFDERLYEQQLSEKLAIVKETLKTHLSRVDAADIHTVPSSISHFRHKCKFTVIHSNEHDTNTDVVSYAMWEGGSPSVVVEKFPIASLPIYHAMPVILAIIQQTKELKQGLRGMHFLSTLQGCLLITLIYDRNLDPDTWQESGNFLLNQLTSSHVPTINAVSIIGRSKGVRIECNPDDIGLSGGGIVIEKFQLLDGRQVEYVQKEDGFSNPNALVNLLALDWICSCVKLATSRLQIITSSTLSSTTSSTTSSTRSSTGMQNENDITGSKSATGINVLELYCGNGNHTVAIAGYCHRLVAVEINDSLCKAARINLSKNHISNATVVTGDSGSFASRVLRNKCWTIKETGERIVFGMVIVDPPRCGLDANTCQLVSRYEFIIYISCNPVALKRDLDLLAPSHQVLKFAVFDQFAYTPHLECGVLLGKIPAA